MIRIKQKLDTSAIANISKEIESQVEALNLKNKFRRGQTVAVACSSRGITDYSSIVGATVKSLQDLGLKPFLIPGMGSHGAATAKGQKQVLEDYGISSKTMNVPIRSSLKTIQFDNTKDRIPVILDNYAAEANYIVPVNRIKSHPDFEFEIESGLMKMIAVGLGNEKGATLYHQAFFQYGYPRVIQDVARKIIGSGKILFGVGIIENGCSKTAQIAVIAPEELESKEKELLNKAKRMESRLPFDDIDILIIDEMGKDISGSGIDTKVVGRILMPLLAKEPKKPRVKRIIVCDLSPNSEGNALGIGLADFITKRLLDKVDLKAIYVNTIASSDPEHAKIPVTLSNDREAIEVAAKSIGLIAPRALKLMRIKNTKHLMEVDISEAYKEKLLRRKDLTVVEKARPFSFDTNGNLKPF